MTNKIITLLLLILLFTITNQRLTELDFLSSTEEIEAYVTIDKAGNKSVQFGNPKYQNPVVPVLAVYRKALESEGWDYIKLTTPLEATKQFSDEEIAYSAGLIEGYLTYKRIESHYKNMNQYIFAQSQNKMPDSVKEYLQLNAQFIQKNINENKKTDIYWAHVNLINEQLKGLKDGYNSRAELKISDEEFEVMNSFGDLFEVGNWKKENRPNFDNMSTLEMTEYIEKHTHCSSLIKIAEDYSDIFFGHTTWFSYLTMTRIFKEYNFKFSENIGSSSVAFSGYPGALSSVDDFYLTHNNLYVAETTNGIFNTSLYDALTPESVLCSTRTIIANRIAKSGSEWIDIFLRFNSGTYNNQFMILDFSKINLSEKQIADGALMIVEQLPGDNSISKDVTQVFRKNKYWASYNSPYFLSVRTKAGYDDMLQKKPELTDILDYEKGARSQIFKRDQANIKTIEDYKKLLRYNDYKNDLISKSNPGLAISARKDLDETNPTCNGGIDTKACALSQVTGPQKVIHIVSGPSNDQQPTFQISTTKCNADNKYKFSDLPDSYGFAWTSYTANFP